MTVETPRFPWVKDEFDRIATNGFLGVVDGELAFGYLRVSSERQAEEGRTGLPRQLLHIHEKACALKLRIPWNLVFFDDHTGFEFRGRPELTRLRELVRSKPRPANHLVIENLDRLSREATWHQGYLLEEFEHNFDVRVHFWKEIGSALERAVYGTVAQDRMLTDLARMSEGNLIKARSNRVTARTPSYGYKFVNSQGGTTNTKKDTHYGFLEPEATVMRNIYTWLVAERVTLSNISRRLIDMGVKAPKTSAGWNPTLVRVLIKNPVYKGEFYAHCYTYVKRISRRTGKEVVQKIKRPEHEWIRVDVPAIVSPEIWDEAQRILTENRTKSTRNAKREYLLSGLVYCAGCKAKMNAGSKKNRKMTKQGKREYIAMHYRCATSSQVHFVREQLGIEDCFMPQIVTHRLEGYVWDAIVGVLLDRDRLEAGMERYFSKQQVETTREEIGFIQAQITEAMLEDQRLYQAYVAGAFDADEFAAKRHAIKERQQKLEATKAECEQRLSQQTSKEEHKRQILASVDTLKAEACKQLPFDLKRRILLRVLDKVTVNVSEEWFELEGAIAGKFDFIPSRSDDNKGGSGGSDITLVGKDDNKGVSESFDITPVCVAILAIPNASVFARRRQWHVTRNGFPGR